MASSFSILVWSAGLLLLVAGGFVLVVWLRRRMSGGADVQLPGFTLADLRELHRKGDLSDVEFERAKVRIVQGAQRPASNRPLG